MRRVGGAALAAWLLMASGALSQTITIDHSGVGCLVAEQYPRLGACFLPAAEVARARVYFRAAGTIHWYAVEMQTDMACHFGVLPRPQKATNRIEYYIEATGRAFGSGRTAQFSPQVVAGANGCRRDMLMAAMLPSASPVVIAPPGAPPAPQGFLASAAAAAGASSGGGGAGKVVVGLVVAGGLGGALAYVATQEQDPSGGDPSPGDPTPGPTASPTAAVPTPSGASITVSPSGTALAGATDLTFTASATGAGTFVWGFGDGGSASGSVATHTYNTPGTFTVTLTASGGGSSTTATTSVTVRDLSGIWSFDIQGLASSPLAPFLSPVPVNVSQSGNRFSGSGGGYDFSGTVADPRRVRFGLQGQGCIENFDGNANPSIDTIQGTIVSCAGDRFPLVMRR